MEERKPFTSSCQESILKKIFNNDGISEMIQGNLLSNAEYMESDSNIFIQYDDYALNIVYDEKIQEVFYSYNDSNDHNGKYKELIITHYNNDDPDFDKVLIKLLFNEDINKFELIKEDNTYRYILEG